MCDRLSSNERNINWTENVILTDTLKAKRVAGFSLISELLYALLLLQDSSLKTLQPELNFPAESSCI